jgi:hypothetical protein
MGSPGCSSATLATLQIAHENRAAGFQDHHSPGVGSPQRSNQGILLIVQAHRAGAARRGYPPDAVAPGAEK